MANFDLVDKTVATLTVLFHSDHLTVHEMVAELILIHTCGPNGAFPSNHTLMRGMRIKDERTLRSVMEAVEGNWISVRIPGKGIVRRPTEAFLLTVSQNVKLFREGRFKITINRRVADTIDGPLSSYAPAPLSWDAPPPPAPDAPPPPASHVGSPPASHAPPASDAPCIPCSTPPASHAPYIKREIELKNINKHASVEPRASSLEPRTSNLDTEAGAPWPDVDGLGEIAPSRPIAKPTSRQAPALPEDFDEWWKAYPRKQDRADAVVAYGRVLRGEPARGKRWDPSVSIPTPAELIAAAKALREWAARSQTDEQYLPMPSTWLNKARWLDKLPTPRTVPGSKPSNFAAIMKGIRG